ncbi:MAG: methyltransferase domain-containing protein [Acidimicrobiia bacterium]|jgi:ubiquinone/menaquinone biosynthesis C-methylase UbiE
MSFYGDQVLPRIVNVLLGNRECAQMRARATATLSGEVLEVGFGSGLNVPHLPATVTRLRAVDPATVGRKLAAERVAKSAVPVEYVGLKGEELPLEDMSVDHVLSTWTLCTIPAVDRAGLQVVHVDRYCMRGPKTFGSMYEGVATKSA